MRLIAALLSAATAALVGCSADFEPGPGTEPEPAPESLRVIVLAPSIARVIQALDALDSVVGVDEFSRRLPGLDGVPSVGGLYGPDLERTIELRPTLVLSVASARQQPYLEWLRERGVRVEALAPYTLDEVLESFGSIGALVEKPEEGRRLAARVRAEIDAVAARAAVGPRRSVALVLERDPLYVAGGGSFAESLIASAGGRNVFGDLSAPYPRVSLEALAARAPDVLIDSSVASGGGEAAAAEVREYWLRFGWVKRVEVLERNAVTLPGPDLGEGARLLLEIVHPERSGS
jgi:ABC-type Fe3+-hydroxamate transport system substrate-binding protein